MLDPDNEYKLRLGRKREWEREKGKKKKKSKRKIGKGCYIGINDSYMI